MATTRERILLVESDPQTGELIAHQTLQPLGYHVEVFESAATALKEIENLAPDLIITNLNLPGISGKDLLVALKSQGLDIPIIAITQKGHESDALQAFRLGAVNFINQPIREAEVVNVVEDTLHQYCKRNELNLYEQQLDEIKDEIDQRVRHLTEIFTIGKLVPSAENQPTLYEKIINTATLTSGADSGWMSVYDSTMKKFILRACLNADEYLQSRLNLPYEDSITSLVLVSGAAVPLHGEALKPFSLSGTEGAFLVVPIKWEGEVIGMLAVSRIAVQPFSASQQSMLEMIAEYASMLIENSRRYQILEQRVFNLGQSSLYSTIDADIKTDLLRQSSIELRYPLKSLMENLDLLIKQTDRRASPKQVDALNAIRENANNLMDISDAMAKMLIRDNARSIREINLNDVMREVANRYEAIAQVCQITIKLELPPLPALATVLPAQFTKVMEGLLSNALKYSRLKSEILIRVEKKDKLTLVTVKDQGEGINPDLVDHVFDKKSGIFSEEVRHFGGIGISLPMIKEIITAHKGKIWVENVPRKGFSIVFSLPQ